jgi:hypothetical protein
LIEGEQENAMTRSSILMAGAVAAAAALSACAPVDPARDTRVAALSTERSCFFTRQINGYSEAPDGPHGSERLYVDTGVNDRYLLETFGPCPDLDWALQIAIDSRMQSSLCTGDTATVIVPRSIGGGGSDRCTARVLGRLMQ